MFSISLKDYSRENWGEVYNRIIGATVFIEDACAECLHWEGGLMNLLDAGAVTVKSLSPFEFATRSQKKGVFITQATSTNLNTVRDVIRNSHFTHCILITTVSLDVLYNELNEGKESPDSFNLAKANSEMMAHLESLLLQWIGKQPCAAEVVHIPLFTISVTNTVFLTPPYAKIYPMFEGKLQPESSTSLDLYSIASSDRAMVRRLASNLNSLFEMTNVKEDIFYMGMFSSLVAGVLENSPVCVARRKNCTRQASLILVDRTLDLCGVTTHSSESLMDKIMAVLPRFPGHATDVAVDVSPLTVAKMQSITHDIHLSPGCISHVNEDTCVQTLEYMMNKSQKEVMFDLYNKMSKIDVVKSPSINKVLRVTPQTIEKIMSPVKAKYDIIEKHLGVLQQALAAVQTLKSPANSQIDLIMNLEKQVLQNLATSRESTSVLNQISHIIKTRKQRNLSLERLLALLVHVYALAGKEIKFSPAHEDNLLETLSVAVFEDHKQLFSNDAYENSSMVTPEECDIISKDIMKRLKEISQMGSLMVRYKSVLHRDEAGMSFEYKGILQQLVEDLVNTDRPDIQDLKFRNDGLKDLLRSGLSILMNTSNKRARNVKHPLDNPVVIIFVVGGITAEECKKIQRMAITSGSDAQLIIGSSKLVNPTEAMRDVLKL